MKIFNETKPVFTVVDTLKQQGVDIDINKSREALDSNELPRIWYIQSLQGIAAWASAIMLQAFIVFYFSEKNQVMFAFGISFYALGAILCRVSCHAVFRRQLAMALSISGLLAVGVALGRNYELAGYFGMKSGTFSPLVLASAEAIILFVHADPIRRFSAAMNAFLLFTVFLLNTNHELDNEIIIFILCSFSVIIWDYQTRLINVKSKLYQPLQYAVLASLGIIVLLASLGAFSGNFNGNATTTVILAGTLIFVIYRLLERLKLFSLRSMIASAIVVILISALTYQIPGIIASLLFLVLGYAHGNKLVTASGVIGLCLSIGIYYMNIEMPLLQKSFSMVIIGSLFLIANIVVKYAHKLGFTRENLEEK